MTAQYTKEATSRKFKTGDAIYYRKPVGQTWDTIPGVVVRNNGKRMTIRSGNQLYHNVTPAQCEHQSENP